MSLDLTSQLRRLRPRGRRRNWLIIAVTAIVAVGVLVSVRVASADRRLVWSDEFTGKAGAAPNPANWGYQLGGNGWGNNELECYTNSRSNSALDGDGHLVITARSTPHQTCSDGSVRDYTSARLTTKGLRTFTYGRMEIRAHVPTGSGIWPAFWALGSDHDTAGWPQSGEIDSMEVVGSKPTWVYGSLHGPATKGGATDISNHAVIGSSLGAGYHTFAVEWSATSIAFSVDGKTYATDTRTAVERQGPWVWSHPFYLLLNLAVGGSFPGAPNSSATWPQRFVIDYVRVYA